MPHIIVTGGAGFIGSHVVDALLEKGHSVTVLDNLSSGREQNLTDAKKIAAAKKLKLEIVKADVSDPVAWEKLPAAEALFHFAAQTSVTYSVENPDLDFKVNISTALHLVKWLRRQNVKHFLYANTAGAMYGEAATFPTPEENPLRPLAPYGATKSFTETYIGSLASALKAGGTWSNKPADKNYFSWASLRLSNIYGPRQYPKGEAGVVPIFIEELANGRAPVIFGTGKNKVRDYTHVKDVARAFVLAFEKSQKTPIDDAYNVATGVECPDIEVFEQVLKACQARGQKDAAFAPALKIQKATFKDVRPGEVLRSALSAAKIKKDLGWKAEISFAQGVKETVAGYVF